MRTRAIFLRFGAALGVAVALGGCESGGTGSTPMDTGADLFRVAVNGSPGGALLSVWGDRGGDGSMAYLAGGYVGVDPAAITDGRVGRLIRYVDPGKFKTVCSTDRPLWWVTGVRDATGALTVIAAGEGGRVVRYDGTECVRADVPAATGDDGPTIWGMYALAPNDVWLVGGSARPDGPKSVLLHYDGTSYRQEAALPMQAAGRNLYKIDRTPDGGFIVVGEAGVVMRREPGATAWSIVPNDVRASDNRIFTVSCNAECFAVGGSGAGMILRGDGSGMHSVSAFGGESLDDLPGLNGVFAADAQNVYFVGVDGFTMHSNGVSLFRPTRALTSATLHGVGGANVILAVGGELGVTTPSQRGVILVRGDDSDYFTFDGQRFAGSGDLRRSVGGFGQ